MSDINIEKIDIIKTVEELGKRQRKFVKDALTREQMLVYDLGVKSTLNALGMIINRGSESVDRLIYQKYGELFNIVAQYEKLEDILDELCEKPGDEKQ